MAPAGLAVACSSAMLRMLLLLAITSAWTMKLGESIGVNYGMQGNNLPTPKEVVQLLQTTSIDSVKLYSSNPEVLSAFSGTGMSMIVGVENELIPVLAKSSRACRTWVAQHIQPYFPSTSITYISVGNEIFTGKDPSLIPLLVPAMLNLQQALRILGVHEKIRISTPHSMAVLASSSPPSTANFKASLLPSMKQLLLFLSSTGSSFLVNAYPYFAYASDPKGVSLDYALFQSKLGVKDGATGFSYGSLFDAQVDAIYFAIKAAGFDGTVPVVVSETGWPSSGDQNEIAATMQNAQIYNANLVKRVASNSGTPFKPNIPISVFIFALFNENQKPGPSSERNFGLFQPSKVSVYDAGLMKVPPTTAPPVIGPPSTIPNNPGSSQAPNNGIWCVAGPSASDSELQQILNFACGEGGADCSSITPGQACFSPNTLAAHASFAMNSYYQRHGRNYWNCFFNNVGLVTATNPSYGTCTYPSQ